MHSRERAYIGFLGNGRPDYGLLRERARETPVLLGLDRATSPATRRVLEQLRLQGLNLELIDDSPTGPHSFLDLVNVARVELGVSSILPLTSQDERPRPLPQADSQIPTQPERRVRIEVVNVGSRSHRAVRDVCFWGDRPVQLFFPLTPLPQTTRIQIEIRGPWPAALALDGMALLDADEIVAIDPMEFEQRIAHYNAMPLGLDDRGFRLLCSQGTLVLQLLDSTLAMLPNARLLEIQLRCAPIAPTLEDDPGVRVFGHPEDRLAAAAAHLAARVGRLEGASA